jgi:predicted membrane-bound dolichyl-phosphate-mannose-protein mannosyltransferase
MSTAVLDIHRGFAAVAALARFPLRRLFDGEQGGIIIARALGLVMPPAVARRANLGPATATPTLPASAFGAHLLKLQQLTASPRRAGLVVPASVLLELLIPLIFEVGIKQLVNGFSGDVIVGAAPRWHMVLWIGE